MSSVQIALTSLVPKDSAFVVNWTFTGSAADLTDQVVMVYDNSANAVSTYDIQDINLGRLRVSNLVNDKKYSVSVYLTLASGAVVSSNTLVASPKSAPNITPQIVSISGSESDIRDGSFNVVVNYTFENAQNIDINTVTLSSVMFKLIDAKTETIKSIEVLASALERDSSNKIKNAQQVSINDLSDGVYDIMCNTISQYGMSAYSAVSTFELFDLPSKPYNFVAKSGTYGNVTLNISQSPITSFKVTAFKLKYYAIDNSNNIIGDIKYIDMPYDVVQPPGVSFLYSRNLTLAELQANFTKGTQYIVSVAAVNSRGIGPYSEEKPLMWFEVETMNNVVVDYCAPDVGLKVSWTRTPKTLSFTRAVCEITIFNNNSEGPFLQQTIELPSADAAGTSFTVNDASMKSLLLEHEGNVISIKMRAIYPVKEGFYPIGGEGGFYMWQPTWYVGPDALVPPAVYRTINARANIKFATSGLSSGSVTIVVTTKKATKEAHAYGSVYYDLPLSHVAVYMRDKTTPEAEWTLVKNITRYSSNALYSGALLVGSGRDLTGTIQIDNLAQASYDIAARTFYSNAASNDHWYMGTLGKAMVLNMAQVSSLDMLKLTPFDMKVKVNLADSNLSYSSLFMSIKDANGNDLRSDLALDEKSYNSNGVYTMNFVAEPSLALPLLDENSLISVKVDLTAEIDGTYYNVNADPSLSAPAVASGKIKYASFTASKLFLVPSQGTVRAQSGNDAKIPFSLSFPSTNWSYVKNVVLQVSKDNEEWIAARTILASSMTSNDTTMSFDNKELVDLSGNAIVNGSKYRLRCHVVPNDIEEVSLPYNGDSGITNAVPFTVATISSSGLASAIDEVNNKITVDASWSIVPGTYSQIYDVYVNGQLSDNIQSLGSSLDVSETSAYLELSITGVADKFGLSYSSPKDAAQQLHNLSLYLVITPKINFNLFTGMNLSYPDHFELPMGGAATGSNNYLTYGSTSSSSANSSTVPGIPLGLSLSTLQVDRTGLQWNRASETSLNAAVDFQVIISRFSDFSDIPVVKIVSHNEDSSLLHSVDILDLPRNVVHYVKVVARNALGSSLDSSVLQFTTLPQVPSLGAITVEQLADDDLARISVDFTKLSSAQLTGYTLVRYEMCVLDHLNNQIGEVVEITSDTTLPIVFEGNFGSEYYFKVKAVLHNILNESFVSDVSYSQSVKIIDYPKIDSVVASNVSADNSSKLVIKVKPNGASEVNIIAFAISADASKASEVKTTKIPDLTGSNLNEYELNFPYLLDTNPKFLVLAANDRGSRYVLSGF